MAELKKKNATRKESLCVEKLGGRKSLDFLIHYLVLPDYQNPLLMVQRTVLETGGSPSALRGTKNCGDKSRSVDEQRCLDTQPWHMKESCQLWKSNYHRGKECGVRKEKEKKQTGEKQTRQQLLLQARSKGELCA